MRERGRAHPGRLESSTISYYYQPLKNIVNTDDDLQGLMRLHQASFERQGWKVVLANEDTARQHKLYTYFADSELTIHKPYNEYHRACYMRWLAYAVLGHPHADFDVINYGFTPERADEIIRSDKTGSPILISRPGAMGLLQGEDYDLLLDAFIDYNNNPHQKGDIAKHGPTDMLVMSNSLDWYESIPYEHVSYVKDYTHPGWAEAQLVHYAHGLTAIPRLATIMSVRPPDV